MSDGWSLAPGQAIRRVELHDRMGGSRYGGISPSDRTPNVLVFSDPDSGEQHGYIDDWKEDGCFHYSGEGQRGDQRMIKGNRAILESTRAGRALRVFSGTGGVVQYQGQFVVDETQPYYRADAPETDSGPVRSVIVFRLRPVDTAPMPPRGLPARSSSLRLEQVPVEEHNTERAIIDPAREPYAAERRESALVQCFKKFLEDQGHRVERLRITPPGEAKPIFTDVYVKDLHLLVEAKGTTDRIAVRMAIGQLLDYRRFLDGEVRCAVLLPSLPREDLRALLSSVGVPIYYPLTDEAKEFALWTPEGAAEATHTSSADVLPFRRTHSAHPSKSPT